MRLAILFGAYTIAEAVNEKYVQDCIRGHAPVMVLMFLWLLVLDVADFVYLVMHWGVR